MKNDFEINIFLKGAFLQRILIENILPNSGFDLRNDNQIYFFEDDDFPKMFFLVLQKSVRVYNWDGKEFKAKEDVE